MAQDANDIPAWVHEGKPETIIIDKVCIFEKPSAMGDKSVLGLIAKTEETMSELITKRKKDISKIIAKKSWKSALAALLPLDLGKGGDLEILEGLGEHEGAAPWIMGMRPWQWRFLPSDVPMQGFGNIFCAHSADLTIIVFNLEVLFSGGIVANDLEGYLETDSGAKYLNDEVHIIMLPARGAVWIPYGYGAAPMACPRSSLQNASPEPITYATIATIFSTRCAAVAQGNLWKNLFQWNKVCLEESGSQRATKSRIDVITQFETDFAARPRL